MNTYRLRGTVAAVGCRRRARNGTASSRSGPVDRIRSAGTRWNSTKNIGKRCNIDIIFFYSYSANIPQSVVFVFTPARTCRDPVEFWLRRAIVVSEKSIHRARYKISSGVPSPCPVFIHRHVFVSQRVTRVKKNHLRARYHSRPREQTEKGKKELAEGKMSSERTSGNTKLILTTVKRIQDRSPLPSGVEISTAQLNTAP